MISWSWLPWMDEKAGGGEKKSEGEVIRRGKEGREGRWSPLDGGAEGRGERSEISK